MARAAALTARTDKRVGEDAIPPPEAETEAPPHPEEMKAILDVVIDATRLRLNAIATPAGLIAVRLMAGAILLATSVLRRSSLQRPPWH